MNPTVPLVRGRATFTARGRVLLVLALTALGAGAAVGLIELLRLGLALGLVALGARLAAGRPQVLRLNRRVSATELQRGDRLRVGLEVYDASARRAEELHGGIAWTATETVRTPEGAVREQPAGELGSSQRGYLLDVEQLGLVRLGPTEFVVPGLFGLARRVFRLDSVTEIQVLPTVLDLPPFDLQVTAPTPWQSSHDLSEDPDYQLRPYQHGDEPRWVHWPSTAKRDALMVRPPEFRTRGTALIVAQPDPGNTEGLVEDVVASVAAAVLAGGVAVTVQLRDGARWQSAPHGAGAVRSLQRFLADPPPAGDVSAPLPRTGLTIGVSAAATPLGNWEAISPAPLWFSVGGRAEAPSTPSPTPPGPVITTLDDLTTAWASLLPTRGLRVQR